MRNVDGREGKRETSFSMTPCRRSNRRIPPLMQPNYGGPIRECAALCPHSCHANKPRNFDQGPPLGRRTSSGHAPAVRTRTGRYYPYLAAADLVRTSEARDRSRAGGATGRSIYSTIARSPRVVYTVHLPPGARAGAVPCRHVTGAGKG